MDEDGLWSDGACRWRACRFRPRHGATRCAWGLRGHGEHVTLLRGKKGRAEELWPWRGRLRRAVTEVMLAQNSVAHLKTTAASRCSRKSTRGRSRRLEILDGGGAATANGAGGAMMARGGGRSPLGLFERGERVNGEGEGAAASLKARRGRGKGHDVPPGGGAVHRWPRGGQVLSPVEHAAQQGVGASG
jgi:hypothetical protein